VSRFAAVLGGRCAEHVRGVEVPHLLIAVAVAESARRLPVPAPSLLVVVGVAAASVTLHPDLVSLVILPCCCTGLEHVVIDRGPVSR
jgi:hypothetical protein